MTTITRRLPSLFARLVLIAAVSTGATAAFADEPGMVNIKDFMFEPMSITVHPGTTVTWKNLDGEPHLVVAVDGSFRSPALDQGESYKFRFDKPGTYAIFCGIHPSMKATVVVK
jgi:plastocyanin